jgi:lantibiotic modifying enzyme
VRAELDVALHTTVREGFGTGHALCHGDLGNADVVLHAALWLGEPEWAATFERVRAAVLHDLVSRGPVCGNVLGVESPGLFSGLAGIGYGLLRVRDPQRVPSVLALELPGRGGDRG